jgi:hypothetical protein
VSAGHHLASLSRPAIKYIIINKMRKKAVSLNPGNNTLTRIFWLDPMVSMEARY